MSDDVGRPIRVGIIGVGWGSVVQVPAFRAVAGFEVAALCARRPERAAAAGEKLEVADVTTDWRELVSREDLDLISICTPVDLHCEQALAAIAAGKHVLVEKPVGLDEAQTGAMRDAAADAGVAHAVCFENRWEPARLNVWDLVRSGYLGDAYFAQARSSADFWHPTRATQSEWMYRQDQGGGYLMGLGSHDIDYLCTLFGEPEAVCADVRTTVERTQPRRWHGAGGGCRRHVDLAPADEERDARDGDHHGRRARSELAGVRGLRQSRLDCNERAHDG